MIFAPENSIVQFPQSDLLQSCKIVMSQCLPIHRSGDVNFQIMITGESPGPNEYVMKLFRTCDITDIETVPAYLYGTAEEVFATIAWQGLRDDSDQAFGIMTQTNPDFDLGAIFEDGDCFRIGIVKVSGDSYVYENFFGVAGADVSMFIVINGDSVPIGVVDITSGDDIADAIRTVTNDQVTVVTAINEPFISVTIHSLSGDTYGNLTIGGEVYTPEIIIGEEDLVACSNCFEYKANPCYTTVLKYRNNEDAFGFDYSEETFYNKVRVGLYIDSPQPLVNENVFRYSDGSHKTLSATFQKEFEGHVDWYDEQRHFAIAVALKHDEVFMAQDDDDFTGYNNEGPYEIQWQNKPGTNLAQAPAKFKVKQTPFYQVNSNCASE